MSTLCNVHDTAFVRETFVGLLKTKVQCSFRLRPVADDGIGLQFCTTPTFELLYRES